MKRATDPRHLARVLALQELFSKDFNKDSVNTDIIPLTELIELDEISEYNSELYESIKEGVLDNNAQIDSIITKYAPAWPLDQIKLVDLQILRIAIYEGFISKITPPKVALDEAIEIAKEFGGETSSKFVNGVLGAIYEETNGKI